ncbi:YSIRK-type signal peptide-containing protein, partial [Streptococcus sp. 959]|uniref:YSIRK-type signal peptide-containing protein n=1 Tax=Streptococcus sp. 959 TaxID=2582655 RepID=UPI0015677913
MENNHSMSRVERSRREKVIRYSVRKVSFGAASVAVAALFMFLGNGAVYAAEPNVTATDSALAATPANNQLDENSGASDSTAPKGQADTTTPAPADATPAPVVSSTTSAIEEKSAEKNTEASSAEANSVENKQQTTVKAEEPSTTSVATTKPAEETATTESNKPKVRKRRAADSAPTVAAADDDPDANRTYEAPEDGASVDDLATKLKDLPETVENEKKLANIDQVGATKSISQGQVSELNEFGGWKAVSADGKAGKFAVARKTANGVFPIETVNTVVSNGKFKTYLDESSFDRSQDYALFLGEVRTKKTKDKVVFDKSPYKDYDNGNNGNKGKGIEGYNGIEKTFKAYSSSTGTGVTIAFKTGFTGDIDGNKAAYKVEVMTKSGDGSFSTIYSETFKPTDTTDNEKKKVTKVDAAGNKTFESNMNPVPGRNELNSKLAEDTNKNKLGMKFGTFQSKGIELPKGVTEYTVRISAADNNKLGMGYQIPWEHYALPVVGNGFAVTQDTSKVAKDLAKKVYDKLTEQKEKDTKWSTPETKAAYKAKLQEIKEKIGSGGNTSDYKTVVEEALEKRKTLNEEQQIKGKAKEAV